MKQKKSRYCIVIEPSETVSSEVVEFQLEVEEKYHSNAALKIPPHITIIPPFELEEDSLPKLERFIESIVSRKKEFELITEGFGSFTVGVIYVAFPPNESLTQLEKECSAQFYKKFKIERGAQFTFTPHLTIAWKDLTFDMFKIAWEDFRKRIYRRKWMCNNITVLKFETNRWQVYKRIKIGTDYTSDLFAV